MKLSVPLIIAFAIFFSQNLHAQKRVQVASPDKRITFAVTLGEEGPAYSVLFKKQVLIDNSPLRLEFDNGKFGRYLRLKKPVYRTLEENYELIVGKSRQVHSVCNEVIIPFEEKEAPYRKINLAVRAFNDGVAFRYEFPQQAGWSSYVMYDEETTFHIQGDPKVMTLYLPDYLLSHEGAHTYTTYSQLEEHHLMDMPTLFQFSDQAFMAVTEAAVRNYAGMYLWKENGSLRGKLSPRLGQEKIKVTAALPHQSPWRVLMISDRVGAFIESDLLTNLNEPCRIEDTSWIKPGLATFPWWNGTVVPDTTFIPGVNFETNKYYIDFCARYGIAYHSVVEYGQHEWYTNDGPNFMPGEHVDVTKPVSTIDMQQICDYAKSKGVAIRVWVHWAALYPQLDKAFEQFEKWGITGMMVDFMDRDDQEMICIQEEILAKAARHRLHIQFHGSCKPTGLHRTYPNEFTREGTRNYECYKWASDINADHDITMPFTRLLAGATDYHLGGFRSVPKDQFKIRQRCPLVTSTRCHMLAMYVVLESYLGLVCDYPAAYEGQAGFEFLISLPTIWDQTVVPNAKVNEYVTVARRKNKDWYVGSLNNSKARSLTIPLDFLEKGKYEVTIYRDAPDTDSNPNHLVKETGVVTAKDKLILALAADGGAVIHCKAL